MGLFSRVKRFFRRRRETTTTRDVAPTTKSVIVTDFTSGESVKTTTTTSPTGTTTVTRTASGTGGGSVSSQREQELIQATVQAETEREEELKPTVEETPLTSQQKKLVDEGKLSEQIKKRVEEEPLGKAPTKKESKFKRIIHKGADIFTGLTFGTFLEHLSRPTGMTAPEIKKEAKISTEKAIKETVIIGVGGYGLKASGKVGLGEGGIASSLQLQQILSGMKIRESGVATLSAQQKQIEGINKTIENIEQAQKDLSDTTKFEKDIAQFEKEIRYYEGDIQKISSGKATTQTIKSLEKRRIGLTARGEELKIEEARLLKERKQFEDITVKELKGLRKIGVVSKFTEEGKIEFTSKQLIKTVSPVGMKLQKSYLKEGRVSWKGITYGTVAVARETGIAFGIGYLTGGTGILAKVGSTVGKLPKVASIGVKVGVVGLVGTGITMKTIRGYKLGKIEGVGKIGAIVGGATATGQVAGFVAGGVKGTKAYYKIAEAKIIEGKATKSIAELKKGIIYEGKGKGGIAKQMSKLETRVTGTKYKIKTLTELKSQFGVKAGTSKIKAISKLEGKVPKELPKAIITKGQTLESGKYIKARLYTKVPKTKGYYQQDVLIKRSILDVKGVGLKGKPFFKGFTKLHEVKVLSEIRVQGKPVKVKAIPKEIFTSGEKYLFRVQAGKEKVIGIGEFRGAKPESIFTSKQFIVTGKGVKVGDVSVKKFYTIGKSRGVSTKLLEQSLKEKLLVTDLKTKQSFLLGVGKKGQVSLAPLTKPQTVQIPPTKMSGWKPSIDTKLLLKIHLSKIVPQVLAKQSALISPTVASISAGTVGLKDILKLRVEQRGVLKLEQQELSLLKLDLRGKIAQVPTTRMVQTPTFRMAQVQRVDFTPIEPVRTATMPTIPVTVVPIIPTIPPIDLIRSRIKKKKKKKGIGEETLTYSEGFTAKIVGLEPRYLTFQDTKKLLSQKLTGLGIRRRVIIK